MKRRTFLASSATATLGIPRYRTTRHHQQAGFTLIGGIVYDGTGTAPYPADVAVAGDRITAVGRALASGGEPVDVSGQAVAPGFIDVHGHTDLSLFVNPNAESKVRQGVTTEVVGQDGSSIGPWSADTAAATRDTYASQYGVDLNVSSLAEFWSELGRRGSSINVASMVGAGTIRSYVVGDENRPATDGEIELMEAHVQGALTSGACGLSSGLEYVPGAFSSLDELVALATVLRGTGLPYASHLRNEDDQLLAAIEEALNVARLAGVPVQVSHLKAQGQRNWWKAGSALALLESARAEDLDVMFDRYPYVAYATGLSSLFPVWSRDGGTDAFLRRLADVSLQPRIERAVRAKVAQLGSWNAVQVSSTRSDALAWARGRRIGDLAGDRAMDPYALVVRIVVEDRNGAGMVGFGMSEDNTSRFLAHPLGMVCSDAGARATYGPMAEGTPHPRAYGSFPKVLGQYCRDEGLMPLETAIAKMTSRPADRLRLEGRGRVRVGAFADLVVFDPETVAAPASFADPHQYAAGIPHVIVNGEFVIRHGEHTGAHPGRPVHPQG